MATRIILPARAPDLPAVTALDHTVFGGSAYPEFVLRQALELWPDSILIASDGPAGALAGYIFALPAATAADAWIWSLAVHPERRGAGIGAALLDAMLIRLAETGRNVTWLTVHPANPAAALYRRAGFVVVRTEPHYFGPDEPRDVLRREASPAAFPPV